MYGVRSKYGPPAVAAVYTLDHFRLGVETLYHKIFRHRSLAARGKTTLARRFIAIITRNRFDR